MIRSLSCWAMSLTISDCFTWKQHFSFKNSVLPFPSLSVGLAVFYSVKPPQSGSLVGPVTKSTAMIVIRVRGQGWQWKSIDVSIAGSSSFCRVWTSQLPEWLEQGSASCVGESCCLWNPTLRRFGGSKLLSRCPHHRKSLPSWLWCGRKWRRTKEPLNESERGEWESWLKAQHSGN